MTVALEDIHSVYPLIGVVFEIPTDDPSDD